MAEQKFKIGDEVVHKSSSTKMVVSGYEPEDGEDVTCEWIDGNGTYQSHSFHQNTLKPFVPHRPFKYKNILP
ncbi:DUF2158 domain-containing protein [Reichenbachiella sp. MALMAid0571]|uniref:YodC family protein n=1 Tax=Reichenbachiella sp. MALMAid0571 TaxID=3143939 RepID=UPI0032DF66FF